MAAQASKQAMMGKPPVSRRRLAAYGAAGILAAAGLAWLLTIISPLPPHRVTLACGPEGSSYAVFGKRYKDMLEKQGIRVRLVSTAGSQENMSLLKQPGSGVDAAFVDGGIAEEGDEQGLLSLGTLCYEPVWFFSRQPINGHVLATLKGKRVSVGPDGSESRALLNALAKRHGLDEGAFRILPLAPEQSAEELLSGRIDAAVLVNSWASPVVRKLAQSDGIYLASFRLADAYVARFPALTKRILPEGAVDLEQDRPSHDVSLLATKTSLVVRSGLHPALQYLLLEVMAKVHSRSGIFQRAGEFPAAEEQDVPLSPEARHYYKSGQPLLQRYMPFWLAALVEQAAIFLLPLLGLAYPAVKSLMWLYGWGMQRKIFLLYGELHWLESQVDKLDGKPVPPLLEARMASLEARANKVRVSTKYVPMLFGLKDNLASVRSRIDGLGQGEGK
jgi:TRAP-type uncharacterized transport system substrate-binding protein